MNLKKTGDMLTVWLGMLVLVVPLQGTAQSQGEREVTSKRVVEDFESYAPGDLPSRWKFVTDRKEILPLEAVVDEQETFYVEQEHGNKFVRAYTAGEAQRITLRNGVDFDWSVEQYPRLEWRWRALHLPRGASEKDKNDTGAAVYVTFGEDWLGRPKSIKYTYSTSLPVGTVVSFGPLKALVVSSGQEGIGQWKTMQRDIVADYRQIFGGSPPDRPVSITLWSDSDTTRDEARADFDDIELLPAWR